MEKISGRPAASDRLKPEKSHAFTINYGELKSALARTPKEFSAKAGDVPAQLSFPMPDGSFARFEIVESPVMAPELAAKFPEIKTYRGQGFDDRTASLRFSVTPAGFHAQILSPNGAVYIDPLERGNASLHASFFKRDYKKAAEDFRCLVPAVDRPEVMRAEGPVDLLRSGGNLRTYRLAMAATGEYVAYHGGTVGAGMAAIAAAVNRITGIYELELAIRLVLVANNDLIVFTDAATDPYSNNSNSTALSANQSKLDQVIGSANYDIGHLLTTTGGGLATLGVVCESGFKARGVTGSSTPTGDSFYVDYIAHEMGHQFGANHTFNSSAEGCDGGSRNSGTAYEPGSGSTILAYAGLCGDDDLQTHSDPYFHSGSFDEIISYITGSAGNCATITSTGNQAPTVNAGPNYVIPRSTPFILTATGSDPNGDSLTYCWEQRDKGAAQTLSAPDNGSSPLFRSFSPTSSPSRTFPRLSDILNNSSSPGEKLPITSRTMNFRVTARDNRAGGGGVNTDDVAITVDALAGPFVVTSPNSAVNWFGSRTVTWNVAGTSSGSINATHVNIRLSVDGGYSFSHLLASSTPNDGSETILLPNVNSSMARIKVEAVGNIFFDISDADFTVSPAPVSLPHIAIDSTILLAESCAPANSRLDPDETVTIDFVLNNVGTANTTNLVVTLVSTNGVTLPSASQTYGVLTAGGSGVAKSFTFTCAGVCGESIEAVLQLQDGSVNLGTISQTFALGVTTSVEISAANPSSILINDFNAASPYPSTILISDQPGTVSKITVSLFGLSHQYPDDIGILLAGPNGETALLMADAGGFWEVGGVNLTFDPDSLNSLPDEDKLVSGTFLPGNFDGFDLFPGPAPAGPYSTSMAVFNEISPNGIWSLYIVDGYEEDDGFLAGGWQLSITTVGNPACCENAPAPSVSSVSRTGSEITLHWNAISGRSYRVEYTDDLGTGIWLDLSGVIVADGENQMTVDNGTTDAQRFYRIILLP